MPNPAEVIRTTQGPMTLCHRVGQYRDGTTRGELWHVFGQPRWLWLVDGRPARIVDELVPFLFDELHINRLSYATTKETQ